MRSRVCADVWPGSRLAVLTCFAVALCDQYLSLCLNQRPAEVFVGCYLNDTMVQFENRAAVRGKTDSYFSNESHLSED